MYLGKRATLQKQASRLLVLMVGFLGTLSVQGQTTYYWNRNAILTSDRNFNKAYNWTTGQDGTGAYIPSDKDDEFTSDVLGSAWTFRDNDNDAGTGTNSLTANADQLTLTGRGADLWGATNQYVAVYRGDIRGNFDVIVKIVSQTNTGTHAKAGILVANDITNLANGGYCAMLTKPDGSVHFERDLSGAVGELETSTGSGTGTFPIWVRLVRSGDSYGGYYKRTLTGAWTNLATSTSQSTTLGKGHVAIFMNSFSTTSTGTVVFDDWQGSGSISGTGHALSMNGSGVNADANAVVASDVTAGSLDLQGYSGTLDFGGRNGLFVTHYDNMDFTGTSVSRVDSTVNFAWGTGSPDAAIAADTWTSRWEGYVQPRYSETYTFFSRTDDGARLWVNGQLLVDKWVNQAATTDSGTIALTAGQKYSIVYEYYENGGGAEASLRWSSTSQTKEIIPKRCLFAGHIAVTGNVNMSTGVTLAAGDGTLEFSGTTGTQVFTVRASQTHPIILKTGASTLQLLGNNLSTLGYFQSAGILDFNGYNLTTVAGGYNRGDLQVWNGTTTTFTNLAGRTLTIAGHASLVGQSGNLLNLNPATAWTLAVTGQLMADYVTVANCNASGTAGLATRSGGGGGNSGWTVYGQTFFWNRSEVFTGSTNFHRAYNWSYNADGTGWKPSTSKDDAFSSTTLGSAWTFRDVDNDETSGSYALSGGQLILSGRGGDMWGATNQFAALYRTDITGDFGDITVKVVSQTNTDADARTGIVMANNLASLGGGGYAYVYVSPSGGFKFAYDVAGAQGEIDASASAGTTAYPCWLRLNRNVTAITAWYKTTLNGAWVQIGAAQTPLGTASGTNSHFGLFLCAKNGATTGTAVFDDFTTGDYFSATDVDLSFGGTGANADVNATLYQSQTVQSIDFTGYTGTLNFNGSNTLTLSSGNATFVSGMGLTPSTGTLAFTATSGTQTFTPLSGATHPAVTKSGAGTLTVATNALTAGALTLSSGTWDWGTSTLSHSLPSISTAGSSTMNFGTNTVTVTTGNCDLSGLLTINTGTGSTLAFTATSGTQVLTPKAGGNTHPNITKSGAGTLQLATNNLTCRSFALTGGFLDFNGRDITTNLSGNFTLTNGTATTLVNLGGRTVTVAGNASFTGQSGNLLNLNATAWTVAATGTLTASYAHIANSNASVTTGVATNSTNGGGNTNWNFSTVDYSAWNFSTRIRFNTTSSGANVSGDVANFPLLVRLDGSNFDFNQALSTGNDIRFVDPDGSALPHEVERWSSTLKKADLWVKVPQIDGNSDRDYVTLYWGNNAAPSVANSRAVFDTSLGYEGVWHFAGGSLSDATANANTLGNNGTTQDTGLVGDGRFMTANNMNLTNNATVNMTSAITVSAWVRATDWTGGNRRILQKSGADDQYRLLTEAGALKWHLPGLTTGATLTTSSLPSRGDWHLLTATYDGATSRIFLDGAVLASQSASGSLATTANNMDIGGKPGSAAATDRFSGWMDELMLSSAALSANHVKLAYETQRPRGMKAYTLEATDLSKWAYSTKLYINTTASGSNVMTDQTDFPLLVRLTRANFDFAQAQSNGADLRFSDSAGNLLSYEIERWDASAKAADVWVLIPSVKGNNDGQWFRMHWGKGSAISLSSGASVFLGSAGYVGVWHLSEDGSTTAGAYKDATGFKHDGTGVALTNASDVAALVGTGSNFTAASNQGLTVANSTALNPAAVTLEAWINTTSQGTNYRRIAGKPFTSGAAPWNQYDLELNDPGNKVIFSLTLGGTEAGYTSTSTISNGTWYHVAGTYDGATQKVYFNGVMEASAARTGSISDYGQPLSIGKYYHGTGSNFDGKIDEVRVSNVARSADWMKLNYESMKSGSTVVRVGERSLDYAKSVQFNFNTTSTGANVAGNVANIPLLVRLSASNLDFTAVRDDGADLKFVDKDGSSLYHEVVEWDKGNKSGKVWVKVPQVDGNSTADFITLYYGCSSCTGSPYAVKDSVWSGHAAVFHLNGGETRAFDAARNAYHGDYQRSQPMAAGITTALAPVFDGTSDYVQTTVPTTAGTRTFSAWIYPRSSRDVVEIESVVDGDIAGQFGAGFGLDNGVFKVILDNQFWTTTAAVTLNTWQHVALKFNATNAVLYKNGVSAATLAYTQGAITSTTLRIGRSVANALYFDGTLNEVQVMDSYVSDDWVRLSYENQKAGGTLLSTSGITAASFTSSKVYKFNTTASGANVAGDVYNFPLLIRLTGSSVIGACQPNGSDIRFLDGDGVTWLDYQIERWKSAAPESAEVWVKVPKIDGYSASDFITLYYNDVENGSVPDGQCGACVFGTDNGFRGTWHLAEDGSNTSGAYKDASGQANHGTGANMTSSSDVGAQVGTGSNFAAASSQMITAGSAGMHTARQLTLEAWVNSTSQDTYKRVLSKAFTSSADPWSEYNLESSGASNTYSLGLSVNGVNRSVTTTTATTNGTWYHIAGTYDGATLRIYHNGIQEATAAHAGTLSDYGRPVTIGGYEWGGSFFNGKIDEPRVHHRVRSADWIKLSYETQRTSSTLFNPSPADFVSSRKYAFNTTRTGANVMGDVDHFPLLMRITGSAIVDAVQNDYDDIRFLDGDGKTWLQYQVERWDKTKDSAEVWVLVPRVDGNSNTDHITLYYDDVTNGEVPNGECGQCVFSPAQGWRAAWHLNEDGNTSVSGYLDATGNANHGQGVAMTSSSDVQGIAGMGQDFNGTTQYIRVADGTTLDPTTLTLSAWVKIVTGLSHPAQIIDKGGNSGYRYRVQGSTRLMRLFDRGATNDLLTTSPDTLASSQWQHVVATASASGLRIYLNGTLRASNSTAYGAPSTADSLFIGKYPGNTNEHMEGAMDEVSVSSVVRSADWIKLSYETQRPSGNVFWNSRPGPNNKASLTATDAGGSISLSWTMPISDSSNADSLGLWVKYSGQPDSVGAAGQTKVAILPKADSAYTYPATYPGTYYFALAVRNVSGQWSPFTRASTDTVAFGGTAFLPDTVYVDSAIGNDANTCTQARSPSTPKLTVVGAAGCETNSVNDTLVIRVMPGTYTDADIDPNAKPIVVASFDPASRAILSGTASVSDAGTRTATLVSRNDLTLRNLDIRCATNGAFGIYIVSSDPRVRIEGCRIYNKDASTRHVNGIHWWGNSNNSIHVANNLIHQPTSHGIDIGADNSFNVVNNVLVGTGAAGAYGIKKYNTTAYTDMTVSNNILYNWDYGISSASANIGVVSNNLFHLVTSGREVTTVSDANKVVRDPLFYSTDLSERHAFKLLPGSPAIDAGTSTFASGAEAVSYRSYTDAYGNSRPQGSAYDIGRYEGSGHTPNPAGAFDSLTNTVSGNTVIVKNSKWKLVWDMGRGGCLAGFYDMTGDTTANLVGTGSALFDIRVDSHLASAKTSNTIAPYFLQRTRALSVVRQRLALSSSLDLDVTYTIHPSGHVYVQSSLTNISSGSLAVGTLEYMMKVESATAVTRSASDLSGISYRNGFGYLATATKDPLMAAVKDLDGAGNFSETWSQAGSIAGTLDSVGFATADLADLAQNMTRHHHFMLYVGENSLDLGKAATLNADAYAASEVSASSGSLLHERSWQDRLGGHWTLDEGAGTAARDRSVNFDNHATLTSTTWVSGKSRGGLRFTTSSVGTVATHAALDAAQHRMYMLWVKPDFAAMGSDAFLLSKGTGTANGWHFRKVNAQNKIKFVMANAEVQSPTLATGAWVHLAASVDGPRILRLYVNGVLTGASTTEATVASNSDGLRMGENAGSGAADRFAGDLDDVRIYHFIPSVGELHAIVNRGFSPQYGQYHLRADNNNRLVALLNESAPATRVQPSFRIDNWFGASKTPKFVYLNGIRLTPNVDFVSDSIRHASSTWDFGNSLLLQVNKVLTGASQTLFVDDDDSTGYMGETARMKTLTMSATPNDKITLQNFSGSTFGSATSGQWYLELDLNGWSNAANNRVTDTGFGEFNAWKAAAISPNLALASATQLVGTHTNCGRSLSPMKFHNTTDVLFSGGIGYAGPANISYTLVDSSATRLSLTLSAMTIAATGKNATLTKRWTVYPTGRVVGSFVISTLDFNMDSPEVRLLTRLNSGVGPAWAAASATSSARWGAMAGNLDFHSVAGGILSVRSAAATVTAPGSIMNTSSTLSGNTGGADFLAHRLRMITTLFESADVPITVNFAFDISKDFVDSSTADSLIRDLQTPAALTAVTGTVTTNDALDFNADGFAEGDGAYTFTASGSGIAHFRFANTVTHFNPAFRIKSWGFGTLPEFVIVDNQTLTRDYHYNAYVNTTSSELILQFNKAFAPGTHLFYIAHKTGLAVTLNRFEAVGGEGVDTLRWTTESEFENLGYHVWRRIAPVQDLPDSLFAGGGKSAGAGVANALLEAARSSAAAKTAGSAKANPAEVDTLPSHSLSPEELKARGYVRITPKLIPGAKGGSSATTLEYAYIDRTAGFGITYEYLLEAVDFSGGRVQYGPRAARPQNPLETALYPNYPNPFNPVTTLRFSLREKAKVSLTIYDAKGRVVRTLIRSDKPMLPGKYRLVWDARDNRGFEVPSGQYFYRFSAPRYNKTRKMILVK